MVLALLGVNNADFDDHASKDFPVDKVAYELMNFDEKTLATKSDRSCTAYSYFILTVVSARFELHVKVRERSNCLHLSTMIIASWQCWSIWRSLLEKDEGGINLRQNCAAL